MAQDWFDQIAAPVGQQGSAPPPVNNDPIIKRGGPDPYQVNKDQFSQSLQLRGDARAEEDQAMQRERFNLERQKVAQEGQKIGVEQGKAGNFYLRAARSNEVYTGLGVGPESIGRAAARAVLPDAITNSFTDSQRQQAEAYQRDFIAATLRYESGAAIPPDEFANQSKLYFPQPGDNADTIKVKERLRANAIEGLKLSAGPAAAMASNTAVVTADTPEQQIKGFRLSPDQESKLLSFAPQASSPAEIVAFARGMGVEIPADQAQTAFDYYRSGGKDAAQIDYSTADAARRAELEAQLKARGQDDPGINSSIQEIATRGASFGLSDEASGIAGILTGSGYQNERDLARLRQEKSADKLGYAALPVEFLGGFVGAGPGAGQQVVQSLRQGATEGAKTGAKLGALAGFGYGEGEQSVSNAVTGGFAGGALGGFIGGASSVLANRMANRGTPASSALNEAQDVAAAAQAEGVPISRPIVDPTVRNKLTYLETTQRGNAPVRQGLEETASAIEQRTGALGQTGTAMDPYSAGEAVQGAGRRFIQSSGQKASALYGRAEKLAGNTKITPTQALSEIDAQIADLSQTANANAPLIKYMEELKQDLSQGGMSIQALRNLRTQMRGQISARNLTMTDAERRVMSVLDKASADIADGLPPQAQAAYSRADQAWRERMTYINDVVQKFIGKRDNPMSAEATFSAMQRMAKGDSRRLGEMMRALEPNERADIAATFAEQLGRGRNGEFSPANLVTQAAKLNPKARTTIFGEEGAQSLENLVKISRAYRDTVANLNNSRTGVANNYRSWISRASGLAGGVGGMATGGPVSGAVGAMAANKATGVIEGFFDARAARLLMNKDVTRWLANAPATRDPKVINQHFQRLNIIAQRNPALTGEIQSLQQRIVDAARLTPPASGQDVADGTPTPEQR